MYYNLRICLQNGLVLVFLPQFLYTFFVFRIRGTLVIRTFPSKVPKQYVFKLQLWNNSSRIFLHSSLFPVSFGLNFLYNTMLSNNLYLFSLHTNRNRDTNFGIFGYKASGCDSTSPSIRRRQFRHTLCRQPYGSEVLHVQRDLSYGVPAY
jgi:hypothetical protein